VGFLYSNDPKGEWMSLKNNPKNIVNDAILKEISDCLESLEYGTVMIKVHASKIIQIEVTQKRRFDDVWKVEQGGGI